ncbi:MAG: Uma2 family endonuclease [Thermomicrobiales bacterium]
MAMTMPHHRFTVDEYEQMVEVGILTEDDRVELIHGEIIAMSPIGPRHVDSVAILSRLLTFAVPSDVLVLVQSPIRLPDTTEPEPDIALVRFARYRRALPGPSDIFALIEVSDTTRDYDRNTKLPLYAAAGVPETWIVDIAADRIERHTEPAAGGYQLVRYFGRGAVVESVTIPTLAIPVDEILGSDE